MILLDKITVGEASDPKYIEFYLGDLSNIPDEQAVDILVVSAFPDDYTPTPTSLIGALDRQGISLQRLSLDKEIDLRTNFSCWLSKPIKQANFKRILCFEPYTRGNPADVVGDIFRSLMPFVLSDPPVRSIAMPLVASGDQMTPIDEILEPLIDASFNWLKVGLPVEVIKIVEYSKEKAELLLERFKQIKNRLDVSAGKRSTDYAYDVFISYSHKNSDEIKSIAQEIKNIKPDIKMFLDIQSLQVGASWQQGLYDALDDCRHIVIFLSEPYIASKVCQEELNIAIFRQRESTDRILIPIYLYSAELPTYIKLLQYIDCREADQAKLQMASRELVQMIGGGA